MLNNETKEVQKSNHSEVVNPMSATGARALNINESAVSVDRTSTLDLRKKQQDELKYQDDVYAKLPPGGVLPPPRPSAETRTTF